MAVSPNFAIDLCLVADVQSYVGGDLTASADELQRLITAISSAAATYCGYPFIQADYVEACNGTGTSMLLPCNRPITAVASIVSGSHSLDSANANRSSGFTFDSRVLYLLGGERFRAGIQNIVVSYTAGFLPLDTADPPGSNIPPDLREAVVEAVADRFKKRSLIGVSSKTIAGELITYTTRDFPASVKLTLNLYSKVAYC